ncbi:hypothetical protein D3C80_127830 [compost metagenome]
MTLTLLITACSIADHMTINTMIMAIAQHVISWVVSTDFLVHIHLQTRLHLIDI